MAKSKKPRKKYNPAKTLRNMAPLARFWSMESMALNDDGTSRWDGNVNIRTSRILMDTPMLWCVDVRLFCRDQNGNEYHESRELASSDHCLLNDLLESYEEAKADVFDSVNEAHVYDYGWLAMPYRNHREKIDFDSEWDKVRRRESGRMIRRLEAVG